MPLGGSLFYGTFDFSISASTTVEAIITGRILPLNCGYKKLPGYCLAGILESYIVVNLFVLLCLGLLAEFAMIGRGISFASSCGLLAILLFMLNPTLTF